MASKKSLDDCVFDFDGEGEGGFFRVPMTNRPGELNRHVMVNTGDKFLVVATLLDVVHGKLKGGGGGDDATLFIASFRFLPSGGKRFVDANITLTFTSDDPAVEVEVEDVAPEGSWALNPVTLNLERTIGAKANIGPGVGPVTANLGGEYGGKQAKDIEYHTLVDGSMRVEDRDHGGFNAVRWNLKENEKDPRGICRMLQVGVLLRHTIQPGKKPRKGAAPTFRGAIDITVDKGVWSQGKSYVERVFKKPKKDEAIVFRPDTDRVSGHFDIDKNDLGAISLTDDIMYMSLHESFDELRKERDERKKKKREEDEKKQQGANGKRNQDEENEKPQEGEEKTPAVVVKDAGTNRSAQTLAWLYYVALGMLGMYLWQQLTKFLL